MKNELTVHKIKGLTSNLAFGIKTEKGVRPSISKKLIEKGFKKPLTKNLLKKHLQNKNTIYFYGNEKENINKTLVMIDIDVLKSKNKGSKQGAIDFANYINDKIIKIYIEPSTNGKGIHGYFILDKNKYTAKEINKILKKFQNYLQLEAKKVNADIELVEIKGTLFELEYEEKKIKNVKYGMLGKVPRNINNFLKYNILVDANILSENFSIEKIDKKLNGSISEKHFSKDELEKLPYYCEIGENILKNNKIKAGKFLVTKEDFGISLMILSFFKKNKNKDNSLPTKRAEMLWKALYKAKEINRAWNHHRWAKIRNILSKLGLIKWTDNRYQISNKLQNIEGIACKWEISDKMYMYLKKIGKKEKTSFVDTNPPPEVLKVVKPNELEHIFHEFLYKIPVLKLIFKEKNDLMYSTAYDYIKYCFA